MHIIYTHREILEGALCFTVRLQAIPYSCPHAMPMVAVGCGSDYVGYIWSELNHA
jgi:hypothetical protein